MALFHFSEDPDISVFHPRVKENRRDMPPVVWAIDEPHQFTFFCPRECPRIVYRRTEDISSEDETKFFGHTACDTVIAFETDWCRRLQDAVTYRYELPFEGFEMFDAVAGYYINRAAVTPLSMEPLDNLLDRLVALDIEVRFTPNLYPLQDSILASTISYFGMHKFHNAKLR